jgi:uncharacterized protein
VTEEYLLIFGASTRAAAFSALRAGLRPWCADLFADRDLRERCPVIQLPRVAYPRGFLRLARRVEPGPWMYTGGLENRPALVRQIAGLRPLWGNDAEALRRSRSPLFVTALLDAAGLACPRSSILASPDRRWLVKPLAGSGGAGIRFTTGDQQPEQGKSVYYQEYIEGEPVAAVYAADEQAVTLLGVSQQLVGEEWLHAARFRYCGSVGPVEIPAATRQTLQQVGRVLARECFLRGLFGVDSILRDGVPWLVEVNPRYTASVEVLEYATGASLLPWHRHAFETTAVRPALVPGPSKDILGKAVYFAPGDLSFPHEGPWMAAVSRDRNPNLQELTGLPAFADIPDPGQRIAAGRPVLTFFARASTPAACWEALRRTARELDRSLMGR